jgi:hypothetical protein
MTGLDKPLATSKMLAELSARNPAVSEIADYSANGRDLSRAGNSGEPVYLYRRE